MGAHHLLILFLSFLSGIYAQEISHATIVVNGTASVAETDANFICATIDWWPHDKCNYNQCPWGYSSATNLNLSNPVLANAVQAFKNLRIRIGGSLQNRVLYDVGNLNYPCHPFRKMKDGLFEFTKGCLHMTRWDELNQFFRKTGAIVTFGLNALYGRHQIKKNVWGGDWNSSNTYDFIKYTVQKGYKIDSWEFGNELSGDGIGARVDADQYGKDVLKLKRIIDDLYKTSTAKPALVAPGGFYNAQWYSKLLQVSGSRVIDIVTHHIYNLGAGVDPNLVHKILDPRFLSRVSETFIKVRETIQKNGPWAAAWVGESGGAFNSGGRHVSNTFVNSFWYLDQLGMASKYNTKVYCRQTLIGGNYGLLNTTTFVPNPDFYSGLLWHRLMGESVLAVGSDASPYLRTYAHCSKGKGGITMLLINLSNQTKFIVNVENSMNSNLRLGLKGIGGDNSFVEGLKRTVAWVGSKTLDERVFREEYHLTPKDGYIRSQTMALNGIPLRLTDAGEIPTMDPVRVDMRSPMSISPLSIAFITLPHFDAPGCA